MSEKDYIIAMEKGQSKDLLKDELTAEAGNDYVPARSVDVVYSRDGSKRHFNMALTDEEAETLRSDPRVNSVHTPIEWSDDFLDFEYNHRNNWERQSANTNQNNWGLLRHIEATNGWGSSVTSQRETLKYTGHLDGEGVDLVVHEGNTARYDHEQFAGRYNQLQWNTLPNMSGASTINYTSSDSYGYHATHVLGTMGGATVGWAPKAQLYSMPADATDGIGNSTWWFDAVKEFHKNKSVDPTTGYRRPTVVNMSWGYKTYHFYSGVSLVTNINYRGTSTGATAASSSYGLIGDGSNRINCPIYGLQSEVEEMQDEGIIVTKSAGNQYQKLDVEGGIDYDNYFTSSATQGNITAGDPLYYNRGASNIGEHTIVVGNMDSQLYSYSEATATSSEKGPRVDVWAAGTDIVSSHDYSNNSYANLDGTSMAAPQVAGMAALLMQMNPGMTPKQVREWFINNAKTGLMYVGDTDNTSYFTNNRNLQDGSGRIAYWPFSDHRPINLSVNTEYVSF